MARSTYVYVVLDSLCGVTIKGTWTVKKEMVGVLSHCSDAELVGLHVYRSSDGYPHKVTELDIDELLNG